MSEHDPIRALWAGQRTEDFALSPEALRSKARGFQKTIRHRNMTEYVAAVLVIAVFGWMAVIIPEPVVRLGCGLIAAGALYVCWKLHTLAGAAGSGEIDAAASLADFHRAELIRQRSALVSVWQWYLLPFVPGMIVFLGGVTFTPANPAPLAAKLVVLVFGLGIVSAVFAGIAWLNGRAVKALDAEIEALENGVDG